LSAHGPQTHDQVERVLFELLSARGMASAWLQEADPRASLRSECRTLLANGEFRSRLADYLLANPVIPHTVETVLAQLAFSAGANWQSAREILQPLARRGQHLARWLPTFLIVDGPLGKLLRQRPSPLAEALQAGHSTSPLLASARDAFNNDLFRKVQNGLAHWSFTWTDLGGLARIDIFHFETGAKEAEVSSLEAKALHYLAASVIQVLEEELIRKVDANDS
jgi:hypothetical protein